MTADEALNLVDTLRERGGVSEEWLGGMMHMALLILWSEARNRTQAKVDAGHLRVRETAATNAENRMLHRSRPFPE